MAKVSVLLSAAEEARFSAYCDEWGYKKSTLIARLIREHLNREGFAAQASLPFEKTDNRKERPGSGISRPSR